VKKSRFTETQIVAIPKEHAAGVATRDLCRKHGVSPPRFTLGRPSSAAWRSAMSPRCGSLRTRIGGPSGSSPIRRSTATS